MKRTIFQISNNQLQVKNYEFKKVSPASIKNDNYVRTLKKNNIGSKRLRKQMDIKNLKNISNINFIDISQYCLTLGHDDLNSHKLKLVINDKWYTVNTYCHKQYRNKPLYWYWIYYLALSQNYNWINQKSIYQNVFNKNIKTLIDNFNAFSNIDYSINNSLNLIQNNHRELFCDAKGCAIFKLLNQRNQSKNLDTIDKFKAALQTFNIRIEG